MENIRSKFSRPGFKPCGCGDGDCDTCHPKVETLLDDALEEMHRASRYREGNRDHISMLQSEWDLIHELIAYAKEAVEK